MKTITKRFVDAMRADPKGEVFEWDTEIVGFGARKWPSGAVTFPFQYRNPQGVQRMPSLGKLSETFTVDQARDKAKAWRRIVENGGDPLGQKQVERNSPTANAVFDAYLESEEFAAKADSTRSIDRGRILRHLRPTLGKKIAKHITKEDALRALRNVRDGKTAAQIKTGKRGLARVTGGEGTARMAIRLLKTVWRWAADSDQGLIPSNPLAEIELGPDGERDTIVETAEQYTALFRTLDDMETKKLITHAHADAIRLIALTGMRRGEAQKVLYRHVDLKVGAIIMEPARHKTGKKTNKPRIITLPAAAQAIVARQPAGDPEDYLFRASKGTGAITLSSVWRKVRKAAGLPADIGLHGLRHSVASHLAMGGAQAAELMIALGHRQLSTTQRYIHSTEQARAALAERAAGPMVAAMNQTTPAEIVELPKKVKM